MDTFCRSALLLVFLLFLFVFISPLFFFSPSQYIQVQIIHTQKTYQCSVKGFVNTIPSWSGLVPLSRLTYCIYLLHIMIMDLYMMNQQTLFYISDMNVVSTSDTA